MPISLRIKFPEYVIFFISSVLFVCYWLIFDIIAEMFWRHLVWCHQEDPHASQPSMAASSKRQHCFVIFLIGALLFLDL